MHFNSLALGSGSNMALPIWGIWMKKCLSDRTIGWSMENDRFTVPSTGDFNFDCSTQGVALGGYNEEAPAEGESGGETEEDYYFN